MGTISDSSDKDAGGTTPMWFAKGMAMSFRVVLCGCLLVCTATRVAGDEAIRSSRGFRIVGYLPDYRAADFDPASARCLTDLIVFSAEPTKDGDLSLDRLKSVPLGQTA
jgi:hypothetical protein